MCSGSTLAGRRWCRATYIELTNRSSARHISKRSRTTQQCRGLISTQVCTSECVACTHIPVHHARTHLLAQAFPCHWRAQLPWWSPEQWCISTYVLMVMMVMIVARPHSFHKRNSCNHKRKRKSKRTLTVSSFSAPPGILPCL